MMFARVIGGDPTPSVIGSRAAPTRHYWPIRRRGSEAEGGPDAVGASFERRRDKYTGHLQIYMFID